MASSRKLLLGLLLLDVSPDKHLNYCLQPSAEAEELVFLQELHNEDMLLQRQKSEHCTRDNLLMPYKLSLVRIINVIIDKFKLFFPEIKMNLY